MEKLTIYTQHGHAGTPMITTSEQVEFEPIGYSGHKFSDFYAQQDPTEGPGWYIFGRNSEKYGTNADGKGNYIKLVARPDVKARRHPYYNVKVRRGWHTKAEAQHVADELNKRES